MKEVLTSMSIFLGSFIGLLTILDWLLSKKTKVFIKDKTETAWFYLNEWGKIDLIDLFYKKKILIIILVLINLLWFLLLQSIPGTGDIIFGFIISTIIIAFSLPYVIKWMTPISKFDFYFFSFVTAYVVELFFSPFDNSNLGLGIGLPFIITTHAFFLLGILWLTIIILLKYLLATLELITLRVVENEKGPILGLSALLIAIGAIIKIFL